MFERFTDRARRVVVLAQEEARRMNHASIGTEHILLGLIHEGEGVAAQALGSLGISLETVRREIEHVIGVGPTPPAGHVPFTPRAKKILELSLRESSGLGHNYIGTEHILLGIIREGEGVGAQVLVKLGAELNEVRQQVIQVLSDYPSSTRYATYSPEEIPSDVVAEGPAYSSRAVTGPACTMCRRPLSDTVVYRVLDVAEHEGEGNRRVLFVYCNHCGDTIDTHVLPVEHS